MSKILQLPLIKSVVFFLKAIKPPGFYGFSIYDLFEMYMIEGDPNFQSREYFF